MPHAQELPVAHQNGGAAGQPVLWLLSLKWSARGSLKAVHSAQWGLWFLLFAQHRWSLTPASQLPGRRASTLCIIGFWRPRVQVVRSVQCFHLTHISTIGHASQGNSHCGPALGTVWCKPSPCIPGYRSPWEKLEEKTTILLGS